MGMTIDEAVKVIHKMLAYTDLSVRANLKADMIDACHMAIDTMRKYQKIKRIIKAVDDKDIGYSTMMDALHKVVDDGNDDNKI